MPSHISKIARFEREHPFVSNRKTPRRARLIFIQKVNGFSRTTREVLTPCSDFDHVVNDEETNFSSFGARNSNA